MMLRPIAFLLILLLLAAAGCKDKPSKAPAGTAELTAAPPVSPETLAAQQDKHAEALKGAGITPERQQALEAEIVKQAPDRGFKLSADKEFVQGLRPGTHEPVALSAIVFEIEMSKPVPEDAAEAVQAYLDRAVTALEEQQARDAERKQNLERIDRGEVVGSLVPASQVIGDWRSLGETREGEQHFLVEHDDAYYKLLTLKNADKLMTYQEFRDGKAERNTQAFYKFDGTTGELTSEGAGGGPGDAFYLMQISDYPDRLFVRPAHETVFAYTVYERVGWADQPPPGAATPPPPGK